MVDLLHRLVERILVVGVELLRLDLDDLVALVVKPFVGDRRLVKLHRRAYRLSPRRRLPAEHTLRLLGVDRTAPDGRIEVQRRRVFVDLDLLPLSASGVRQFGLDVAQQLEQGDVLRPAEVEDIVARGVERQRRVDDDAGDVVNVDEAVRVAVEELRNGDRVLRQRLRQPDPQLVDPEAVGCVARSEHVRKAEDNVRDAVVGVAALGGERFLGGQLLVPVLVVRVEKVAAVGVVRPAGVLLAGGAVTLELTDVVDGVGADVDVEVRPAAEQRRRVGELLRTVGAEVDDGIKLSCTGIFWDQ